MFRPLRIQYPDAWYHVMNRGRRGETIFSEKKDYETFIDLLEELDEVYNAGVCIYYKVKESDLRLSRRVYFNEPRNVGIYLLRHLRNDALKETGKVFKIYKYSTVSSIVERVKQEMGRNKNFKKRIEELSKKN